MADAAEIVSEKSACALLHPKHILYTIPQRITATIIFLFLRIKKSTTLFLSRVVLIICRMKGIIPYSAFR